MEGEKEITSQYPSKPDYYAHTPPRICQGTPIRPTQPEVIYEREPRRTVRLPTGQNLKMTKKDNARGSHPLLVQEIERPMSPSASLKPKYYAMKEEWDQVIKGVITAEGGTGTQKTQGAKQSTHGQQSNQKSDHPQRKPPPQEPRQSQGAGSGEGGDDPSDPSDSDGSGLTNDQDEEEEETETKTEMEEEEIPQDELPKILKGHKVHRVRVPSKLLVPAAQDKGRSCRHGGGGGGSSRSPSPPPNGRRPHKRKGKPKKRKPTWVYMVQGPPGLPGKDGKDGKDGASAPPIPAP